MLIAIVLSLIVMIVWSRFFAPKPPAREVPPQQAIERVYDQPAEPQNPQIEYQSVTEEVSSDLLGQASDVVVKTPNLEATFSTLGGHLVSLKLPEFESKRGGKVELVPQTTSLQKPLALEFHAPEFGVDSEKFLYNHALYEPTDSALQQVAQQALEAAAGVGSASGETEVRRLLEETLPKGQNDPDLRSLVIAALSNELPAQGSGEALAQRARSLQESSVLVFSHQLSPELRLIKGFVFGPQHYSFVMHTVFQNTGQAALSIGNGRSSYSVIWAPGLESPEKTPKSDELVGVHLVGKNFDQETVRKLKKEEEFSEELKWIGLKRKYFFASLEPADTVVSARIEPLGEKEELVGISLNMQPLQVEPDGLAGHSVRICAGPMLKEVLDSCGSGYGQILNFGFFDIFAKMLLAALLWFNKAVQSYGLAIILLTIVVRLALFPLNQKSYRSMRAMQSLQPKVNEIREKYKKNPQEMNKKMMELYRTNKVNPMGGCLPIAFQMPIFIALFQALRYAVELRGARFLWMVDLSEPDRLFTITQPFNFSLNLLPLLVIGAMVIQQKMTPMAGGGQSEAQQKMMQYMPVIFGFLFYSMPSGLTVYFLVSTVLGLVQQYFVQKAA
ncbi:MAG: membrane protein insertase YidC [Candidatus Abyssobacteria bacterium SURF_5]|uniref:Membrane protein insertase YidC n=1 Tax=Abyssobacteria bacterium (strain SURF_5) TaxID=2093360 RepID=A0A3A4NV13_ABYX5|nr:MAG: membrane protein insertase YidC [Candidatus Abyssubacteria bacterium SURF_5]